MKVNFPKEWPHLHRQVVRVSASLSACGQCKSPASRPKGSDYRLLTHPHLRCPSFPGLPRICWPGYGDPLAGPFPEGSPVVTLEEADCDMRLGSEQRSNRWRSRVHTMSLEKGRDKHNKWIIGLFRTNQNSHVKIAFVSITNRWKKASPTVAAAG